MYRRVERVDPSHSVETPKEEPTGMIQDKVLQIEPAVHHES